MRKLEKPYPELCPFGTLTYYTKDEQIFCFECANKRDDIFDAISPSIEYENEWIKCPGCGKRNVLKLS